jgi:hypothetical protein
MKYIPYHPLTERQSFLLRVSEGVTTCLASGFRFGLVALLGGADGGF